MYSIKSYLIKNFFSSPDYLALAFCRVFLALSLLLESLFLWNDLTLVTEVCQSPTFRFYFPDSTRLFINFFDFSAVRTLHILFSILSLLGIGGQLSVFALLVTHVYWIGGCSILDNGLWGFAPNVLFFLMFADTTRHLRVSPKLTLTWIFPKGPIEVLSKVSFNLLKYQLFTVYFFALAGKLLSRTWRDGIALEVILRSPEVTNTVSQHFLDSPGTLKFMTYFGLTCLLITVLGLLVARLRWIGLFFAVLYHGGITVLLGLPFFSMEILSLFSLWLKQPASRLSFSFNSEPDSHS